MTITGKVKGKGAIVATGKITVTGSMETEADHAALVAKGDIKIQSRFTVMGQNAQDRSFTSNSLRHAYATHMHEAGIDLYTLKNLLGHRFFTTTQIYIHLAVGNWLGQYERCHPLASEGEQ